MEEHQVDIFKALETVRITTVIDERAPQSDHELMRILREGEEEHDLDKIYQFIEACERGRGLAHDATFKKLIEKGFEVSPERVMRILAAKRHVERCICLALCDDQKRIAFIRMGADGNMEFLYECLRQLISYGSMTEEKRTAIVSGTVMLSEGSEELWRRMIRKKEYNKKWLEILGQLLSGLSERALVVYAETIHMDMPENYGAFISDSLQQMDPESTERLYRTAASCIYARWKEHLNYIRGKKSGLHEMFTNGYVELIYHAALYLYSEQKTWENEFAEVFLSFEKDLVGWYLDAVEMTTVFFADVSELCMLLCVAVDSGIYPTQKCREMLIRLKRLLEMYQYLWKEEDQKMVLEQTLTKLLISPITGKRAGFFPESVQQCKP